MISPKITGIVLGIVILVFAFWETTASKWIIVVAAVLMVLSALLGKKSEVGAMPIKK